MLFFQGVCIRSPIVVDFLGVACGVAVGIISMLMPADFSFDDRGHLALFISRVGIFLLLMLACYAETRLPKYAFSIDDEDYFTYRTFLGSILAAIGLTAACVGVFDFLLGYGLLGWIKGFTFKWLGFLSFLVAFVSLINMIKRIARR